MTQSNILFVGMDVHKESIVVPLQTMGISPKCDATEK